MADLSLCQVKIFKSVVGLVKQQVKWFDVMKDYLRNDTCVAIACEFYGNYKY